MISILLPAYKSRFLNRAIKSILNQTYKDWELIIVNDKSPQPIDEIVSYYLSDKRIHYYINSQNVGKKDLVANWNICLSYAKGEFFALLCDDDEYEPTFLENMITLANKYPSCNVFRSGVKVIDSNNKILDFYPSSPEWENCEDYIWHVFHNYRCQTISEWFYRTYPIRDQGGFISLPIGWFSDFISIFTFSLNGGIASTTQRLVKFRMSNENITSQKELNADVKMEATYMFKQKIIEIINQNQINNKELLLRLLKSYLKRKYLYALSVCSWKDWIRFITNKRKYDIDKKIIFKSLCRRISI